MKKTLIILGVIVFLFLLILGCEPEENMEETIKTGDVTIETKHPETPTPTSKNENTNEDNYTDEEIVEDWLRYTDDKVGFSLEYPTQMMPLYEGEYNKHPEIEYIQVEIADMSTEVSEDDEDYSFALSPQEMMTNVQTLAKGWFGINYDYIFEPSKKVSMVADVFAQEYMVLSRHEICDVTLERKVLFYYNNKQIIITSHAPIQTLKDTMPEYFWANDSCPGEMIREFEKQDEFYDALVNGNAAEQIQRWYNEFDDIRESVMFLE